MAPLSQLFSALAVGVLLLFIGFLFWMHRGLAPVLTRLEGEQVITAYLTPQIIGKHEEENLVDTIRTSLGAQTATEVKMVSSQEFLEHIKAQYPELARELEDLGEEAPMVVPRYIYVSGLLPDSALERVKSVPGIESAESSKDRYHHIVGAFHALRWVAMMLVVGLLLALLTGLIHLSRMNAYLHQEALSLLKLWGAGNGALKIPGVLSALGVGSAGGLIAAVGWLSAGQWLAHHLRALSPMLAGMPIFSGFFALNLFIAGIVMGLLAGGLGGIEVKTSSPKRV